MGGSFEPAKTGNAAADRNFREMAALINALPEPATYAAVRVTGDYQATGFEGTIHVDASRGPVRVTMPAPSKFMPPLTVKQVNDTGSPGAVTVVARGGKKAIAGASTFALDDTGTGAVTFTSDGVQHWPGMSTGGNPAAAPPVSPATIPSSSGIHPGVLTTVPPLEGGGPMSANLTLTIDPATETSAGSLSAADKTKLDNLPPSFLCYPLTGGGSTPSRHDAGGAEFLSYGWFVPFSLIPSPVITVVLGFYAASAAGVATFRLRVGGTYRALDGTVPPTGTATANSATMTTKSIVAAVANPGVDGTIKLTQQSSGAGVDCEVDEANGAVLGN